MKKCKAAQAAQQGKMKQDGILAKLGYKLNSNKLVMVNLILYWP